MYVCFVSFNCSQVINLYLVHFQNIKMSDYWNFFNQVIEFRRIKDEAQLTGRAYLLFKKYLAENAYRYIDCIPETLRTSLEQQLKEAIDNSIQIELNKITCVR